MNAKQKAAAQKAMINWLAHPDELGKEPYKTECTDEFDLHGLHYYVFRFKEKMLGEWKLAVCGGYEEDELEHSGHIFSDFKKYNEKTAVQDATGIVERIRAYWMQRAAKQESIQDKLKKNTDFRTREQIPAAEIEAQFVKSESRYFLKVGCVDCPTGHIVTADPLAYLPSGRFSPVLDRGVAPGCYDVWVSVCRQENIGIRMCTAKMVISDKPVVVYQRAGSTAESAISLKDGGTLAGFPVDAGMMCFCDAQSAKEYVEFVDGWYQANGENANHYDDYFAALFAKSYQEAPAYQREGGDFLEWANPNTQSRLVTIASGLGDGFYNAYYGLDEQGEVCQVIVPMVNPDIFEC